MRSPHTKLYAHCVWSTWDRLPLLTVDIRDAVYAAIANDCQKIRCYAIAIGGIDNHVHLLVRYPPTVAIATLIKQVKGSSSHFITHELRPNQFFKWQGAYGAFSVSPSGLDTVAHYIRNQEQHHSTQRLYAQWEPTCT